MQDAIEMVGAAFILFTIFVSIVSPLIVLVICLFYYLKKRLDHKQIMAAIEKGTPLTELQCVKQPARRAERKGPRWVKSIVVGIALIIISLPFLVMFFEPLFCEGRVDDDSLIPFGVFFGIGFALFIRGLLLRKLWRQSPILDKTDTGEGNTQARVTEAETSPQLGPGAEAQD
jgi:hypothetical protein